MIPFLIIALIIAIIVIIVQANRNKTIDDQIINTRVNEQLKYKIVKFEQENEKLLKEIEEFKNKYQALWNLKNKVVDENIEYRTQIKRLSEKENPLHSNAIHDSNNAQINSLTQEIKDLTNKYNASRI